MKALKELTGVTAHVFTIVLTTDPRVAVGLSCFAKKTLSFERLLLLLLLLLRLLLLLLLLARLLLLLLPARLLLLLLLAS